jgi:hypothetical protein
VPDVYRDDALGVAQKVFEDHRGRDLLTDESLHAFIQDLHAELWRSIVPR